MQLLIVLGLLISASYVSTDLNTVEVDWGSVFIDNFNSVMKQYFNNECANVKSKPYRNLTACMEAVFHYSDESFVPVYQAVCPFGAALPKCYETLLKNPKCKGSDEKRIRFYLEVYGLTMGNTCNNPDDFAVLKDYLDLNHINCITTLMADYKNCQVVYMDQVLVKGRTCPLYADLVKCVQKSLDEIDICSETKRNYVTIFNGHSKSMQRTYHPTCQYLTAVNRISANATREALTQRHQGAGNAAVFSVNLTLCVFVYVFTVILAKFLS